MPFSIVSKIRKPSASTPTLPCQAMPESTMFVGLLLRIPRNVLVTAFTTPSTTSPLAPEARPRKYHHASAAAAPSAETQRMRSRDHTRADLIEAVDEEF